jgi:hypothetical protein
MRLFRLESLLLWALFSGAGGYAQTVVDLRTQSKSVDFSGAASTRPAKTGTSLPASCSVGEVYFKTDAAAGLNWYGCTATNVWTLQSGGGGGSSTASQLGDFRVERTSSTVLTMGASCSATTPCNVRYGTQVYSVLQGGTVTISTGTGTARFYLTRNGVVTVGHDLGVSCSTGCVASSGVSSFPTDSVPLWTWTATNGTWDTAGGSDQRAVYSGKVVTAGVGLLSVDNGSQTTLSVDSAAVGLRVAVPASSTATCSSGAWASDSSYFYICYQANGWRRAALSSW